MSKLFKDTEDTLPPLLEQWLKEQPTRCSDAFMERLQQRISQPATSFDELFRMRDDLFDPDMARKVRSRISRTARPAVLPHWLVYLRPLAAAALLTLTFYAFRQSTPAEHVPPIAIASPAAQTATDLEVIFALASTLDGKADLAQLDAHDKLAFLID